MHLLLIHKWSVFRRSSYTLVPVIQYTKTETDIAPALDTQIVRYQSFVLYSDLPVIQYTITETWETDIAPALETQNWPFSVDHLISLCTCNSIIQRLKRILHPPCIHKILFFLSIILKQWFTCNSIRKDKDGYCTCSGYTKWPVFLSIVLY